MAKGKVPGIYTQNGTFSYQQDMTKRFAINFFHTRSDAKKGNPTKWKKFNNLKDAELFYFDHCE